MSIFRRKKQTDAETESLKSFLDMIAPSIVKFETGYYICGNTFRCIWALREYPTSTDDLAILRHLGEKHGVTLHIYTRMVSPLEERKIVHNAEIRNRMNRGSSQNMQQAVEAESNLQDVANLIGSLHRNKEPLLHCAVYIEMIAGDMQELQILQTNVEVELMRSKLNVDRLKLRQQAGFCAVSPVGFNVLGTEYERVLPASSVANLFPFNYSGKTDRKGFYIGKDKYGSNIVVDFDQRDEDKTSANVLILGNSGQGKSYLMKLLLLNFLEAGKSVITLDVEHEQWELCQALGGCFADIIEGTYKINLLEPRCWDTDADPYDVDAPKAFRQSTRLAQHTSFLKDVFRTYKDFTTAQIDTIEIMLTKLYTEWGITEETDFSQMRPEDYPILSELYDFIEIEYENFDETKTFDDIYIEKSKNITAKNIVQLYNESLQPYFRLPLEKSHNEFKNCVFDIFKNNTFIFNIYNKNNNELCGFIRLLTYDNLNYIMDMTLLNPFCHNFERILAYCYKFLDSRFKNFNLIFKNKKYQINSNFFEDYFKENKINMVYREIVLVKDYFNYIKENNETKIQNSKIIFFNDINQNPAF